MNQKQVRIALIERGERLVDLHRATGIPYSRLMRIINGYGVARPQELRSIAAALHLPIESIESSAYGR